MKINFKHQQEAVVLGLIAFCVFLTGLEAVLSVLFAQARRENLIVASDAHVTILVGLTLVYLAGHLRRGKRTAWAISLPLFLFILARNFKHFIFDLPPDADQPLIVLLNLLIPLAAVSGLIYGRKFFRIKGGADSFGPAIIRALVILLIAFLYGAVGYQLLDTRDFRQEISPLQGARYTINQFGLDSTNQPLPHTKRAKLFSDSLSVISIGSLFYVGISLFSPLRFRLSEQQHSREAMRRLLENSPSNSEDFFKLWPHDKAYYFTDDLSAGLAYKVKAGVALCVGDPAGDSRRLPELIKAFIGYCHINDWEPALIHTEDKNKELYKKLGFEQQKIGEEALVDVAHFQHTVAGKKYFRNIRNKFQNAGYSWEALAPPHHPDVIKRLAQISSQWLKNPGRSERGFMMGYFSADYMNQCTVIVARDGAGTIQAFINQVSSFDKNEANFDLLRSNRESLGNINDFIMMSFISHLEKEGFKRLNMGLSPLAGLDIDEDGGFISDALNFLYINSGRLYSFSGLKRFKDKYEPQWQDRFIVYRGGLRGFGRTLNALVRAMRL